MYLLVAFSKKDILREYSPLGANKSEINFRGGEKIKKSGHDLFSPKDWTTYLRRQRGRNYLLTKGN